MRLLTTGELASLFSISKYTIRHYIDIGLLVPKQRKENGYYLGSYVKTSDKKSRIPFKIISNPTLSSKNV